MLLDYLPQVTDIMVAALNADCALLNSGTLRSDQLHKAGEFSLRVRNISSNCQVSICCLQYGDNCDNVTMVQDLLAILPMMDDLILLDVSGDMIHKVSKHFMSLRTLREIL